MPENKSLKSCNRFPDPSPYHLAKALDFLLVGMRHMESWFYKSQPWNPNTGYQMYTSVPLFHWESKVLGCGLVDLPNMGGRKERQRPDDLHPLSFMLRATTSGHSLLGQHPLNAYSVWMWKYKQYIHTSMLLKIKSFAPFIRSCNGFCYLHFLHADLIWILLFFHPSPRLLSYLPHPTAFSQCSPSSFSHC